MSNFINPQVLAAEALDQLDYELVAGSLVYRDRTSDFSQVRGMKVGEFISIRTVTDFQTNEFDPTVATDIVTQEVNQSSTQLKIEKHFDVSVVIGARERALNLDGIRKEIINPAMTSMAQKIDTYLLTKVVQSQGLYASGSPLSNAADIALLRKAANLQQISKTNRIALLNEDLEAEILGNEQFNRFDIKGQAGATGLEEATIGRLMGIDWFSTVNFPNISGATNALEDTDRVNGAPVDLALDLTTAFSGNENQQGNTTGATGGSRLTIAAGATGSLLVGDKIQIAGAKRAFTIAVAVPDLTGLLIIDIAEQINENLFSLAGTPAVDPVITVLGGNGNTIDYQGIVFNPGAYGFAAPPLDAAAGDKTGVASADGMSIRVTEAYNITTKETVWSFDMIVGAAAVDARLSLLIGKTTA